MLLAACETDRPPTGVIGSVEGFAGAAVADEPRAVLTARDALSAGGSAADAAVALYFALAVTLPSSAGLGGGGVCIVHDPAEKRTEALDFLPRAAPAGKVALPGNVRGMAALHARYGKLRWEQLLMPAENLARFGTPMSRALAREVATAGDKLRQDPQVRAVFTGPDGALLDEGQNLRQVDLAAVLAQIRLRGAGAFYTGPLAQKLAAAAQSIGAPLTADALRGTLPQFVKAVEVPYGNHVIYLPPDAGGIATGEMIAMLTKGRDWSDAPADEQPHLFVEASKRAFAERARWMQPDGGSREPAAELVSADHAAQLMANYRKDQPTPVSAFDPAPQERPENPWATGFVVIDRKGLAVACDVTMNDLFGSGRMAPGTGVILAPAPQEGGPGAISLNPMIMANEPTGNVYYAAAASGGATAVSAMAGVFLRSVAADEPLEEAVKTKRLHHNGAPDQVFYEEGESDAVLQSLKRRGHALAPAGLIGRVNAIWCPDGLPSRPKSCQAANDPRADGLATVLAE